MDISVLNDKEISRESNNISIDETLNVCESSTKRGSQFWQKGTLTSVLSLFYLLFLFVLGTIYVAFLNGER